MASNRNTLGSGEPATVMSSPHFDITNWNPEGPASLQFMSLLAVGGGDSYQQQDKLGKMKTSVENRKQRLKMVSGGGIVAGHMKDGKKLLNAVCSDDFNRVCELINHGGDVNCADEKKRTPLHMSAAKGNVAIVEVLLRHGADPNKTDILENTPLHLAACVTHIPVITALLKSGAKVDALDKSRRSPLHLARGRLRMLHRDMSLSTHQFRMEVNQIIDMMKQYLISSGTEVTQLDKLCQRLQDTTTLQNEDAFNQLLDEFTSLEIKKDPAT